MSASKARFCFKMPSRTPLGPPGGLQDCPTWPKMRPGRPILGPTWPQDAPTWGQDGPKQGPRCAHKGMMLPLGSPVDHKMAPMICKMAFKATTRPPRSQLGMLP